MIKCCSVPPRIFQLWLVNRIPSSRALSASLNSVVTATLIGSILSLIYPQAAKHSNTRLIVISMLYFVEFASGFLSVFKQVYKEKSSRAVGKMAEQTLEIKKGRKRSSNFSNAEKEILADIIRKHQSIIECKKTDCVSVKQKNKTWDEICVEFNATQISGEFRTTEKLKLLWDNLKRQTRKHHSLIRQETFKTGGGSNILKENRLFDQVKEIIGRSSEPLQNPFDDDAVEATSGVTENLNNFLEVEYLDENYHRLPMHEEIRPSEECGAEEEHIATGNEVMSNKGVNPTTDWLRWNPQSLKQAKAQKLNLFAKVPRQSDPPPVKPGPSKELLIFDERVLEEEELGMQLAKRVGKKPYNKKRGNTQAEGYAEITRAKLDYLAVLKKGAQEKQKLEKEILEKTLLEQDLKIELLRRQLAQYEET